METTAMFRRIGCTIAIMAAAALGCGLEGTELPELPRGFDDQSIVDGKGDLLTHWLTEVKGEIAFGTTTTGKTSYTAWFHGYTFDLGVGDEVAVKASGSYYGLVRIYGPRQSSGAWGSARAKSWIGYASKGSYSGAIGSFKAAASGTYLLVVGSPWDSTYAYDLSLACSSGHCGDAFCTVYETTDAAGAPLRNYYAINVDTYAEGKQLLAQVNGFINEAIYTGACSEVLLACPKVYMPVCGDSPGYSAQTFGNVCNFKAWIRKLAAASGEAKGHWEPGACATCDPKTEWWRKYVSTDPEECKVLKFYCQPHTTYFSNTCGCGCQQDASCKQYYDCEPPTDCSSLMAKCPFSTFGL
jgi:hypothetical protein